MSGNASGSIAAHERLRDALIAQIHDGTLKPGEAIPAERKLAEHFAVSRHTVRQALSALESFGMVTVRHGSGAYVTESVPDTAIDRISMNVVTREGNIPHVVEVRRSLEPYMARLAAERHDDTFVERLKPLVPYRREHHGAELSQESTSFHREIARATHNPVFDGVMRTLISGPRRAEAILTVAPQYREEWERHHELILAAIETRDGAEAERLMALHMDAVMQAAVEVLSREG